MAARHLKKVRRVYKERRDLMCQILQETVGERISFSVPRGGMSLWVRFRGVEIRDIAGVAAQHGLFICDGTKHNTATRHFNSVCLGFASMNDHEMEQALTLLSRCIAKAAKRV